jgi:trigger factor
MQVTETLSTGLKRGYTVVLPAADIEGRRAARLTDIGKSLRLPGFRPGKVPMSLVKQRYGTAVIAEILEESVNEATQKLLSDRGLRPAGQPKVDLTDFGGPNIGTTGAALEKDLEFKVELELLPDIQMPDFGTISLTRYRADAGPEAVDRALAQIATRNRDLQEVTEDRGAAKGEVLTVDFIGKIDGEAFDGGTATDATVEVAGDGFIPGFTEQLEGVKVGEIRTLNVAFPADYGAENLAGKNATFDVTVKALKHPVLPAIDDELAKKMGLETLDQAKEMIAQQIQREYDQLARLRIKRQLLDALAKQVDFALPDGMVDAEFNQIWQRIEADLKEGRQDDDDKGKDEETLRGEYRAIAERRVRLGLLLADIGRVNGLTVSPEELTRAMRVEAMRYPGQEQQVMEFFRQNQQAVESLRGPIFEDKVVDYVLELANVTDETVTPEALAEVPEA